METDPLLLVATFFVALISSLMSGVAGGGGGFIMGPWELLIGFSPAQMIATGSIGSSGIMLGSVAAMQRKNVGVDRKLIAVLSLLTAGVSLIASVAVPHVETHHFKTISALLTLAALPLFFSKHRRLLVGERSLMSQRLGYLVMSILAFGAAVTFNSIFGLLIALALPFFFGLSTIESTAVRRITGLSQSLILVIGLFSHILWFYAIVNIIAGYIGSYLGTHLAIKHGETFARRALGVSAAAAALALVL